MTGASRAATRTGSPTLRGWTNSDSVAVDVARAEHHRARVLALRELRQFTVLDDHQPGEATGEASEREGEDRRQHEHARPDGGVLHWAGGLGATRDAARLRSASSFP